MKIPFNVDAYTARLIGRENVSKLDGAILELVKNTYDADASICLLYYENSTDTLYIADNGIGMSEEVIRTHWMTIGYSSKANSFKTEKGRIQTGAKGIGRFALDRVSDECTMITRSEKENIKWTVNWDEFHTGSTITSVYADIEHIDFSFNHFISDIKNENVKKIINDRFNNSGTIFKLTDLRDDWNNDTIDGLKNNLATLIPPEINETFQLYFFDETVNDEYAKILENDGIFSYDYKIEFSVGSDQNVELTVYRDEFDFKTEFERIMSGAGFTDEDRKYFNKIPIKIHKKLDEFIPLKNSDISNIGNFSGVFYYAKNTAPRDEKEKYYYKDFTNRKDYRGIFGGIKIYRDNFRVRPYGEPNTSNYDWLLLSNRKTKSPAGISHPTGSWKVNADQILGSIFISRTNITLPDQANRQGIVETVEFGEMKTFLLAAISVFERDRQYVCRKLNSYYEKMHPTVEYEKEIKDKSEKGQKQENKDNTNADSRPHPEYVEASKAHRVIQEKENAIKILEDENRMLRTLATTGIVTNTYIHEIKDLTHKLSTKIIMAKEALEFDDDKAECLKYIIDANNIREAFNSWFKITIESVRRDKRKMGKVDLTTLLGKLIQSWNETVNSRDICIVLETDDVTFKCFPYEIESIINNLIANSLSSFDKMRNSPKNINICLKEDNNGIILEYHDSGIGLSKIFKKNPYLILEPFESDKVDNYGEIVGTGMGMWIIKNTVDEYNGSIDLSRNIVEEQGFYITVRLNNK